MTKAELTKTIRDRLTFLCIGLDTDAQLLPDPLMGKKNGVLSFNKAIIDATAEFCISYKINTAFYEALGSDGWIILEKTIAYIKKNYSNHFVIADAKRGDIGNTARQYARAFFETLDADAITLNPYMGKDSIEPFLNYDGKWVILLALTSNKGAGDFQMSKDVMGGSLPTGQAGASGGKLLFETVLNKAKTWAPADKIMFVAGATRPQMLADVRNIVKDHFLLIPGVGAQGGSLNEVAKFGMNSECGLIVNLSRTVIYAGKGKDFAEKAREESQKIQRKMQNLLLVGER